MAKIILKWRYYKANDPSHSKNYVNYIATREGVEKCDESWKLLPITTEQERFIKKMLTDFPSGKETDEYKKYLSSPNRFTASRLISVTIDDNIDSLSTNENYMKYIALRPHVEKQSTHGLFTQEDIPINLNQIANEVANHQGIVWRTIISLSREDATRLHYDNASAWKNLIRNQTETLAKSMGIPITDLRWYAAFHNEGHHPHVHLVSYSIGKNPYMTLEQLEKLKASFAHEIFKNDFMETYQRQTSKRDELRATSKHQIEEIMSNINNGVYKNEKIEQMLFELASKLKAHKGKVVYGYLNSKVKNIVNTIVDEIAKDEKISELYDLWYKEREEILKTYTDHLPKRVPLSQNDEFKSIRNAIIKEVLIFLVEKDIIHEAANDEPLLINPNDKDEESRESGKAKNNNLKWELYKNAKLLLDKHSKDYNPLLAVKKLEESANLGCGIAKYKLGKLFLTDEHSQKNIEQALKWLESSAEEKNPYAEYLLGKLYFEGKEVKQNVNLGKEYLLRSADHKNKYASYTLGKAFLDGTLLEKNISEGLKHLTASAERGFEYAEYLLGKIYFRGEIVEKDVAKALHYLERSTSNGNSYAAYLAGSIYMNEEGFQDIDKAVRFFEFSAKQGNPYAEFQLGKMFLFGKHVQKDYEKGMEYLKSSASHGFEYAEEFYKEYQKNQAWSAGIGAFRLFSFLAMLIKNQIDKDKKDRHPLIDRKLRRMINQKKEAHGIKFE